MLTVVFPGSKFAPTNVTGNVVPASFVFGEREPSDGGDSELPAPVESGLAVRQALCSLSSPPWRAPFQALIASLESLSLINIPSRNVQVQSGLLVWQPLWSRNSPPWRAPFHALIASRGSRSLRSI